MSYFVSVPYVTSQNDSEAWATARQSTARYSAEEEDEKAAVPWQTGSRAGEKLSASLPSVLVVWRFMLLLQDTEAK